MPRITRRTRNGQRRRAAVTVQVALSMTFVMGFAALSVDIGSIYVATAELQRSADAAAMAAALELGESTNQNWEDDAREAANDVAVRNSIRGKYSSLNTSSDVIFGKASADPESDKWVFNPGMQPYDAVQVTVRRSEGSDGGPIQLAFGKLFGKPTHELQATATAMLIPRDLAVVIDLSGSMNYDSELRYWNRNDGGYANTRDVWCALDGPEPDRPYLPGPEDDTQYTSDTGPSVGVMSQWGNPLIPGPYSSSGDPGLWYIRKNYDTTLAAITTSLTNRGFNAAERSALMSKANDGNNSHWQRRCGVMLGLASWNSGMSGGFAGGNGDNVLDSGEVSWIGYPPYRKNWTWTNYVDWVQASQTASGFKYRYGLKTFVDFLLDNKREFSKTVLWNTPQQPLTSVKDAVQTMIDSITSAEQLDHLSLVTFGTTAKLEVELTDGLQVVPDTLYERQAAHFDATTNIGSGLLFAINELKSERARPNATKMIVLMSDGVPNVDGNGSSGTAGGIAWALEQADHAKDEHISVTCISVGYGVDRTVMQEIATIANGQEFYAAGSPEEYAEELQNIFRTLGGKRPVALID